MKKYISLALAAILCGTFASCSKKESVVTVDDAAADTETDKQINASDSVPTTPAMPTIPSAIVKDPTMDDLYAFAQSFIAFEDYIEKPDNDNEIRVYYLKPELAEDHGFGCSFKVGEEQTEVVLPCRLQDLLDSGFTLAVGEDMSGAIASGDESEIYLLTPETGEPICFFVYNGEETEKNVAELPVISSTLTSSTNFSFFETITQNTDIKSIVNILGNPDGIVLDATASESLMLFDYSNGVTAADMTVYVDGVTKNVICIMVYAK